MDEATKLTTMRALYACAESVHVMTLEAKLHPEFCATDERYQQGWLDAMSIVAGVMAECVLEVEKM